MENKLGCIHTSSKIKTSEVEYADGLDESCPRHLAQPIGGPIPGAYT